MTTPAEEAAAIIASRCDAAAIEFALILDENFYGVAELGDPVASLPYAELPGFPAIAGDGGEEVVIVDMDGASTAILKGRSTFYETGDPSLMSTPVECLSRLGVRGLLSMGLARTTQAHLLPENLVMVTDQINFTGLNPLIGATAGGRAMVDMNEAYDKRLARRLKLAAVAAGLTLHEGVLMWFSGPSFETPAEIKMARQLGADLVGWTIAPEAILARRFGLPFGALAVVVERTPDAPGPGALGAGLVAAKRLMRAFLKNR
jgi:purine-nucleoside phosphorylase